MPYGAPVGGPYGQPYSAMPGIDPRLKHLNDQSTLWFLVAIIGFWMGFGFITGPLAWIQAAKVRQQYRSLGLPPNSTATAAWVIGIISTVLFALVILGLITFFMFFAAAATL